jgi:hypothetical protein
VPWLGNAVEQGTVVYVAPEGSAGLGARVRAWKTANRVDGDVGVYFLPATASLLSGSEVARLVETMRSLPRPPVLVVFDTLARSIPGGDENSATDMGTAIASADRIRDEVSCAVLLVHHTNAGGERERGSTALRGGADTMMILKKEGATIGLECTKQKDAQAFETITLQLVTEGDSCVVVTPNSLLELQANRTTGNEALALMSLQRGFLDEGASASQWMKACPLPESSFFNVRTSLVRKGLVNQIGKGRGSVYQISEAGKEALTPNSKVTPKSLQEPGQSYSTPNGVPFIRRGPLE